MTTKRVPSQRKTRSIESTNAAQLTLVDIDISESVPVSRQQATGVVEAPAKRRQPRRPGQVVACGWCGAATPIPARGRVPKWCSSTCRHRAWEQRRAKGSGRSPVDVVDRVVEVVRVEKAIEREVVEVPVDHRPTSGADFAALLVELATRLDTGRIYDRDIPAIDEATGHLYEALMRRLRRR